MEQEKDSMELKEGQAEGGGRMALITSGQAQRHCANYSPCLLLSPLGILDQITIFCWEQSELGAPFTGVAPCLAGSCSGGQEFQSTGGKCWLIWRQAGGRASADS
jgi:hypothetical protein